MDEVTGILLFTGAMFAGLWALSWACGDFRPAKNTTASTAVRDVAPPREEVQRATNVSVGLPKKDA